MSDTFRCPHCGQSHPGLPTDWAFKLPDEVHALNYLERYARTRHNSDLCTLDESRFFVRTLLNVPLLQAEPGECFCWGVWVEVERSTHDLYLRSWDEDISAEARAQGTLANAIPVFDATLGLPVQIEWRAGSERPLAWLAPDLRHALALEQRMGISGKRHHDILVTLGYFDDDDSPE